MDNPALRFFACFTMLALLSACTVPEKDGSLLIANVNIVDVQGKRIDKERNILIRGGRIDRIADNSAIVSYDEKFDANGAYATAGLIDAHVHIDTSRRLELMLPEIFGEDISDTEIDDDLAAYAIYGVTGVIVLSGDEAILRARERSRDSGAFLPRIVAASPILDGPTSSNPLHKKVSGAEEGVNAVNDAAATKYDLIKVYNDLDVETRNAIITRASEFGLPVVGHLPPAMTLAEAIVPGFSNVAHAEEITRTWDGKDAGYLDEAARLMAKYSVSFTPNLVAYREIADEVTSIQDHLAEMDWALTPPLARVYATPPFNGYVKDFGGDDIRDRAIAYFLKTARNMDDLTLKALRAGVLLLAGSDTGNPTMFPGQSLHRELELLKAAGLDGYEAIAAATLNPAVFLGEEEDRGSIAPGKIADLVLFDVNPAEAERLRRSDIAAVIKDGVLFDRERLNREAQRLRGRYDVRETRYRREALAKHAQADAGTE